MFLTKILQLIDKNPDNFKHWSCSTSCCRAVCYFRNSNAVTRYVCFKLNAKVLI